VLCILGMALKFISTFSVPVRTDAHLAEIKWQASPHLQR
jgi:hypothetical protein